MRRVVDHDPDERVVVGTVGSLDTNADVELARSAVGAPERVGGQRRPDLGVLREPRGGVDATRRVVEIEVIAQLVERMRRRRIGQVSRPLGREHDRARRDAGRAGGLDRGRHARFGREFDVGRTGTGRPDHARDEHGRDDGGDSMPDPAERQPWVGCRPGRCEKHDARLDGSQHLLELNYGQPYHRPKR